MENVIEKDLVDDALKSLQALESQVSPETLQEIKMKFEMALYSVIDLKSTSLEPMELDEDGAPKFKSIDLAIRRYVDERDQLRVASASFKRIEEDAKDRMQKISMWLREKGDEFGVDSFKTPYGTAYRSVKTSYRVGEWSSFIDWILKTHNTQCLEKRVAKLATKEIHDQMASCLAEIDSLPEKQKEKAMKKFQEDFGIDPQYGGVPPGIEYSAEVEFDVRRPTKSKSGD